MGLLNTVMTDGGSRRNRWAQFVLALVQQPAADPAAHPAASGPSG